MGCGEDQEGAIGMKINEPTATPRKILAVGVVGWVGGVVWV